MEPLRHHTHPGHLIPGSPSIKTTMLWTLKTMPSAISFRYRTQDPRQPRTHNRTLNSTGALGSIRTWSYLTCPCWLLTQTLVLSHHTPIARGLFLSTAHHQSPDLQFPQLSLTPTHSWLSSTMQFTSQCHTRLISRRGDNRATSSATPHSLRCWNSASPSVTHPPASFSGNYPSATQHPEDVTAYISKELQHSAIIGPVSTHPFDWPAPTP